jgi:hypothetical protein
MKQFWMPGLVRYLIGHPRSVSNVIRVAWRLRRDGWWRTSPYLPLPYVAYWDFRRTTALGTSASSLSASDVVDAATWAARQWVGK